MSKEAPSTSGTKTISSMAFYVLVGIALASVILAAAAVVASIREDVKVADLREQIEEGTIAEAAASADEDPSNRHVSLTSGDGQFVDVVLVAGEPTAFVTGGNLPELEDRIYQLWANVDETPISVAILGSKVSPAAFNLPANTSSLRVTDERSTGAVAPSTEIVRSDIRV